jgi:hypothetical protein
MELITSKWEREEGSGWRLAREARKVGKGRVREMQEATRGAVCVSVKGDELMAGEGKRGERKAWWCLETTGGCWVEVKGASLGREAGMRGRSM